MFSHTFDTMPHTMLSSAIFGTKQQSTMNEIFQTVLHFHLVLYPTFLNKLDNRGAS